MLSCDLRSLPGAHCRISETSLKPYTAHIPTDEIESCVRLSWGAKTDIDALSDSINQLLDVAKGLVF